MAGYSACLAEMEKAIVNAREYPELVECADALQAALVTLKATTETLLGAMMEQDIDLALANSVKYLDLFGHVVIAWMWLWQATVAAQALSTEPHESDANFYRGKLQAMQYFFRYELPEIEPWSKLLCRVDDTCYAMSVDWF